MQTASSSSFPFFRRETTFSLVGGIEEEEEEEEEEGRRGGGQLEKTRKNLKGGRDPGKLVAFTAGIGSAVEGGT